MRCGIDAESALRFESWLERFPGDDSLLFHPRELAAARAHADPAAWLCRCFCLKEAVFKAWGEPYEYRELEFIESGGTPGARWWGVPGAPGDFAQGEYRLEVAERDGEITVMVVFWSPPVPS